MNSTDLRPNQTSCSDSTVQSVHGTGSQVLANPAQNDGVSNRENEEEAMEVANDNNEDAMEHVHEESMEVANDNDGEEEDVQDDHHCGSCQMMFSSLSEYVEHKFKVHKQKITFSACEQNPQIILPQLAPIYKRKKSAEVAVMIVDDDADKQNAVKPTRKADYLGVKCAECGRLFRHQGALDKHRQVNHRVYICDECPAIMSSAGELKKHMRSHVNSRPYLCTICNKTFKRESVLQIHLRVHSDKREFKCHDCGDSFKTKGSLDRHTRRHTGERPFTCSNCGKGFRESGSLTRHMRAPRACYTNLIAKQDNVSDANTSSKETSVPQSIITTRAQAKTKQLQDDIVESAGGDSENQDVVTTTSFCESAVSEHQIIEAAAAAAERAETADRDEAGDATNTDTQENPTTDIQTDQNKDVQEVGQTQDTLRPQTTEKFLPFQCRACRVILECNADLREHLKTHIGSMPHRCGLCTFATHTRHGLQDHMMARHGKRLVMSLTQKVTVEDGDDTPMEETEDDKVQTTESQPIPPDLTPEQDVVFSTAYQQFLEMQDTTSSFDPDGINIHGYKDTYQCSICEKCFRGKSYFRTHLRKHTGEKPFVCQFCPKRFRCKDFLNKHLLIHTNERRYKCGECGKLYKRITHVKEHLRIHSNERPFTCTHCNKSFKTKTILNTHLKIHVGELTWKCQYCHKAFREKASVIRHERSHTGEKPFRCDQCGRGFAEHGTLARHKRAKVPCKREVLEAYIAARRAEAEANVVTVSTTSPDIDETNEDSTAAASVLAEFSSVVANTQEYIVNIVESNPEQETGTSHVEDVIQTVILTESMLPAEQQQQQGEQEEEGEIRQEQHQEQHIQDDHQDVSHQHTVSVNELESGVTMVTEETGVQDMAHSIAVGESVNGPHPITASESGVQDMPQPIPVGESVNGMMVAMKADHEVKNTEVSIVRSDADENNPELETVVIEM